MHGVTIKKSEVDFTGRFVSRAYEYYYIKADFKKLLVRFTITYITRNMQHVQFCYDLWYLEAEDKT